MKQTISLLVLLQFIGYYRAQEVSNTKSSVYCQDSHDKKAIALYIKGKDKKKYKKPERLEFLMKCLELEPDFAEANLAMAFELVARCVLESKAFTPTLPFFYKAIAACPKIHSEPYYYIGFDYYERTMNDSAIKYLQLFLDFKDDDEKKFSNAFAEEQYQAKMMIKTSKKEMGLKKNVPFDPRVVVGVSTERDEYLAYISPDDRNCFFVRKLPLESKNQVYASDKEKEVFMIAQRDNSRVFNSGEPMGSPFNETDDNQGGCSISIDNKHLYFAMMKMEGGLQPNCDIYVSDYSSEAWGEIRKLSPQVNDPKYWDSQPSISADGTSLYFASDRPGGYGGIDIYITKKDPKSGQWSVPQNLGPQINTRGDEKTPFIHSDSETLYFSSNGHFGFGEYDILLSRRNEKGEWQEPENIGSPINGSSDDTGFFVSSDAKTGYFFSYNEGKVSGRGVGRWDLFSFDLYQEARPNQMTFLKGTVKDTANNQVAGAQVIINDIQSKSISYALVDSSSGEYMAAVKKNHDVLITVKKEDFAFNSTYVKAEELKEVGEIPPQVDIQIKEAREGSSFVINNLYYTTNSAEIKNESKIVLLGLAQYLNENKNINVEIQGHTDNVGNAKDNLALSSNRAYSVKTLLEEYGVIGDRITAKGFGSTAPIYDNNTEEGRAKNRRTEFKITAK